MTGRQLGFYCLTLRKPWRVANLPVPYQWIIGHWNGSFWKLPGSVVPFRDDYFEYINEESVGVSGDIEARIYSPALF